ncbi:MAG: hypothetical protein C4589_09475 [Peptococcaceae bacterium]|nr:MAG: hypothetical protein C4589_09475 [Peptococcaceae bacterium]
MSYKDREKQNEYLRRWREKRRNIRIKQGRKVARTVFFLLFSENPRDHKNKILQILPLVFGRLLNPDEEEFLFTLCISLPRRSLESLLIAWRESYRRDLTIQDFRDILFAREEETCAECGRPYLKL